VEQTALAHDPVWPAQSADVRKLVGRGVAEPVSLIELGVVHQGPGTVVSRVKALSLCVAEAETLDDLGVLGEALASLQGYVLPCGSAGLAAAWADAQGLHGDCTPMWRGVDGPVLIVSGSRNAATLAQLQALYDADSRLAWCELDVQAAERAVDQAGRQAAEALRDGRNTVLSASRGPLVPGAAARTAGALGQAALGATTSGALARAAGRSLAGLVLTGGDTAMQVCQALGIAAFSVVTAIEPGIPGSLAISGPLAGLPIVTKAGGFGSLQALRRAVEWIHTGQEPFGGDDAA